MAIVRFDEGEFRLYAAAIHRPGDCREMRFLNADTDRGGMIRRSERFSKNLGGWYDSIDAMVNTLRGLVDSSAYITANPVRRELLARSYNKPMVLRRGEESTGGTTDADILCHRYLYIDIDPIRPAGISATQEEVEVAVARRDLILDRHRAIANASIWGRSGNGCFLLTWLPDLEVCDASTALLRRFLAALGALYDDDRARIDPKTFNAARIVCVPGTRKCKGSDVPDRPWRMATLDSDTQWGEPLDVEAWVEEHGAAVKATVSVARTLPKLPSLNGVPLDRRIISYLAKFDPAVMGNNGSDQTFDAACVIVKGFGLSIEEARPYLEAWNQTHCVPPWSDAEMDHKLLDADKKWDDKPRGYLRDAPYEKNGQVNGHTPTPNEEATQEGRVVDVRTEDDPHRLAILFLNRFYSHPVASTLRYWQDEYYAWDDRAYRPTPRSEIRAEVTDFLKDEFLRLLSLALMRHGMKATQDGEGTEKKPTCRHVTTGIVQNVIQAIMGLTLLKVKDCGSPPAWVADGPEWEPSDVLPANNGLIHLKALAEGRCEMVPPTPAFFSPYALGYDFDPEAPDPETWIEFLGSIWPRDPSSIEFLQEWMGHLLTPDTSQQKIATIIGPRRSGKGTISRVIRAMIGENNVVNPPLASLASNFGLSPLIGKPVAIITDARISGRTDTAIMIERLLAISGEDAQTIDRKHRDQLTTKLPTRFMIFSNLLPKIKDPAGALTSRMIFLQMTRSWYGEEDTCLFDKLLLEMPGILKWSVEGWRRLRERGCFIQPESGLGTVKAMEKLSTPVGAFLQDCCYLQDDAWTPTANLYMKWKVWCEQKGKEHLEDEESFGRDLRAAIPGTERKRRRVEGRLTWGYTGVRLLTEAEYNPDDDDDFEAQDDAEVKELIDKGSF